MSISSKLEKLETDITSAYSAIDNKGGTIPQNKNTENLANAIGSISTGIDTSDATAIASDILSTKTAYVDGVKLTGSMANNGALSYTPSDSQQIIPSGYTSGGTISAMDITTSSEYADCLEIANNILYGQSGYTKLQYIQSNGNQYIETGVNVSPNIDIELSFYSVTADHYGRLWGTIGEDCEYELATESTSTQSCRISIAGTNNQYAFYVSDNNFNKVKMTGTGNCYVNDNLVHSFGVNATTTSEICLFYGYYTYALESRVQYCKIWDNGTLIRYLIPVKDTGDVVCMYDLVNQSYYYNSGTGTFTAGPNAVLPYTKLEYIESTGTQYINTNYIAKAHDKIVMDCIVKDNTTRSYECLFGACNSSLNNNAYVFFNRFMGRNVPVYNRSGAETEGTNMIYDTRITLTTKDNTATWTDGSNTYSITATGTIEDCVNSLFILDKNTGGPGEAVEDTSKSEVKIYGFKLLNNNNNLILDLIPIKDSNNVVCLYDLIHDVYYYNSGTGSFVAGTTV